MLDIRSFKLLIEKFNGTNPYNRSEISIDVKNKALTIISHLKKINLFNQYDSEKLTPEQEFNQYIIETFQKIDSFGYNTNVNWFKQLNYIQLKKMWVNLEDIWSYRSNLSIQEKNNIVIPSAKQPFLEFKIYV